MAAHLTVPKPARPFEPMKRGDGVNEYALHWSHSLHVSRLPDAGVAGEGWEARLYPPLWFALRLLAGTPRAVIYDLPRELAPHPAPASPVSVLGCHHWQRFLKERRRYDDGEPALIVALRPLDPRERRLVVDWGTAHANAFLLVEPRDPTCDLTDFTGAWRCWAEAEAASFPLRAFPEAGTTAARLLQRLQRSYGLWARWDGEAVQMEDLDLTAGGAVTLWEALTRRLHERFPPEAFLAALGRLRAQEPELFRGRALGRAVMPFRTRLGLPVPYAPHLVLEAARQFVNSGQAWAFAPGPDGRSFSGPSRRIPEDLDGEALASLVW